MALNNNELYAIGGHNGLTIYSSVECYCLSSDMSAAAACDAGAAFPPRVMSSSPNRHAVETASWVPVARMRHRRCRHGIASLRNRIIVAGGYNGMSFLRSVEVFDPSVGPDSEGLRGQWTEIVSLNVPRSRVNLAVTGGRLYAVGTSMVAAAVRFD